MQRHTTIAEATFIPDANLRPIRRPRRQPIHKMLVSFSAAYFAARTALDFIGASFHERDRRRTQRVRRAAARQSLFRPIQDSTKEQLNEH